MSDTVVSDGPLPLVRRLTLDSLPEYAREVLSAAVAGTEADSLKNPMFGFPGWMLPPIPTGALYTKRSPLG